MTPWCFCPANLSTVQCVWHVLDIYKLASDQKINLHKSSVAFSYNTPLETQQYLADLLGILLENKHEVYFGLPAVAFHSKRVLLAALKDCICKRIQGRHEKSLSHEGKAVLIQAVVQAIPSYAISFFSYRKHYFRNSMDWRLISFGMMGINEGHVYFP
ncbi:UNVERIFIED_CONTAM: hypothetical protein Slati_3870200 [Sesamum latifolium]|uniref:Uncharacterized protein n=1 Tax=Sesamum latifolium TaxID=2727402 RepID=A0AAW2TM21_9LAMI